jgi:hypothetical protein
VTTKAFQGSSYHNVLTVIQSIENWRILFRKDDGLGRRRPFQGANKQYYKTTYTTPEIAEIPQNTRKTCQLRVEISTLRYEISDLKTEIEPA